MGICNSISSSKKKKELTNEQLLTYRSQFEPKFKTAMTVYQPGEQFFIQELNDKKSPIDSDLREKVELSLALKNLPIGGSSYKIEVFISYNVSQLEYTFLGITEEIIRNQTDIDAVCSFEMSFVFNYYFETEQLFKFNIYNNKELITQTLSVGKVMGSKNCVYDISLPNLIKQNEEKQAPVLNIKANKKSTNNSVLVHLNMSVLFNHQMLQNQFHLYYIFSRRNKDGNWKKVYKSDEYSITPNSEIVLNKLAFNKSALLSDNETTSIQEIRIEFMNVVSMSSIGLAEVNLFSLKDKTLGVNSLTIMDTNNETLGDLKILYDEEQVMTFIDYLKYGIDINLVVAIDYTASNGNPKDITSLHYISGKEFNDYEKAILSCGKIVAYYDKNQMFPVYGFGGIPLGMDKVQHCFPINGQQDNRISSVDNIATVYRQSIFSIQLSGPTYFYKVIKHVLEQIKAENNPNENKYYILLLLTDGIINDMNETCDIIVEASIHPLSIIIIGIGNADFSLMKNLDGDDELLTNSKGEKRQRDLVQFVRFNDYKDSCVHNAAALAADVLDEIPRQIDDYYKLTKSFNKKSIPS